MLETYWQPVWLTLKLASLTTLVLLLVGTPIAWWLARSRHWLRQPIAAVVALPLVLPPTVLGFYLLLLLGPNGWVGQLTERLGLGLLPFTFEGLVVASVIYSLPFTVQPLQNAFEGIREGFLETAATLRAGPWDRFFFVVIPLARNGFITAMRPSAKVAYTVASVDAELKQSPPRCGHETSTLVQPPRMMGVCGSGDGVQ